MEIKVNLGYKYRLYPNKEQKELLGHQMFISNQAYNICLNLQQENWERNKNLEAKKRTYLKSSELDDKIKFALKNRNLTFKSVVAQQARINAEKALKSALTIKNYGFPKFKNSKLSKQSFNWNNQGYSLKKHNNSKYKILRIMSQEIKFTYSRDFPENAKVKQISFSKEGEKYFVSFTLEFQKTVFLKTKENLDLKKAVGIDLNIDNIALSKGEFIKTQSKKFSKRKYDENFKILQRKQSRRVELSKKTKQKLGKNFQKTQEKLNKKFEKSRNQKKDYYHKITSELIKNFDLMAVEDLKTKNMTKRAKNKNVKQKSGLNRSISNTSFYQFSAMLEYKTKLNDKLFVKVPPQYTSKICSSCGQINENLKLSDRIFECICGFTEHRDTNASINFLSLGLRSFGLGTSLVDSKHKAFRLDSSESIS